MSGCSDEQHVLSCAFVYWGAVESASHDGLARVGTRLSLERPSTYPSRYTCPLPSTVGYQDAVSALQLGPEEKGSGTGSLWTQLP